ncbi:MAG: threonine aldolase [Saprospiraceae bacterium]|jgi:threonine aldolase
MSTTPLYNSFASDNTSSVCPEVMDAIIAANSGVASSYGDDQLSKDLNQTFSDLFEKEVVVFPVMSGTASNALALSALVPSYGKVFCHEMSHINTDECAAPEFFTGGAKLVPIVGDDGKLTPQSIRNVYRGAGNVHAAQPSVVSIAQSCEVGAVYLLEELNALGDTAKELGLSMHMDGARFANGLASLDVSPAQMTWQTGVDVLSFGGTKNGCMLAEAVIFFNPEQVGAFPFLHKRAGQLISKMRYVSAQLQAYVKDDVWLRNARHANAMAQILSKGLTAVEGINLAYPTQSNEIFADLPQPLIDKLNGAGFAVTEGELDETAPPRFVTAWNTKEAEIQALLDAI